MVFGVGEKKVLGADSDSSFRNNPSDQRACILLYANPFGRCCFILLQNVSREASVRGPSPASLTDAAFNPWPEIKCTICMFSKSRSGYPGKG